MTGWRNLGDVVAGAREPGRTALIDLSDAAAPREWTFDDLDRAAAAVARGLVGHGRKRGERVAILSANRAEYLAVFLGAMRAGLVAVPVNLKLPVTAIEHILHDAAVSLVFVDRERRPAVSVGVPVVALDAELDAFADSGAFSTVDPDPDEVAMILYTSGSSGLPKGVPLTHAGALWTTAHRLRATPDMEQHRLLVAAPLYHMNALWVSCVVALPGRASVVMLPRFTARPYIEAIAQYRCTWLTAIPTMMALVLQDAAALAAADCSSVRRIGIGSAPLTQALVDRVKAAFPGAAVTNGWGTTESGPVAFGPHPRGVPRPDVALGYPVEGVEVRLVAGDDHEADEGVLQIRTPALMPGYLNLPHKTAEVMTADGYYVHRRRHAARRRRLLRLRRAGRRHVRVRRREHLPRRGRDDARASSGHPAGLRGGRARRGAGGQAGGLRRAGGRGGAERRGGQAVGAVQRAAVPAPPPRRVRE